MPLRCGAWVRKWQILLQKSWRAVRSIGAQSTPQIQFLAAQKSETRFLESRWTGSRFYPTTADHVLRRGLSDFCNKIGTKRPCTSQSILCPELRELRTPVDDLRSIHAGAALDPNWKRINVGRHKIFEGPRKPELTEAQKTLAMKCQELARAIERLRSPDLSQGIPRELRKQVAILEGEIAELHELS